MFVYALAMLAHSVEWALARRLETLAPEPTASRTTVSVGARGLPAWPQPSTSVDDVPAAGTALGSPPRIGSSVEAGGGGLDEGDPAGSEGSDRYGRIGLSLTVLAMALHLVGVVTRGVAAERVPWGSMYEFAITGSLAVAIAYLVLVVGSGVRWMGLPVTGFLVSVLGVAVVVLYRPVAPLVAALNSYWIVIHVTAAVISSGAFTIGAICSILFLKRQRLEVAAAAGGNLAPRRGFLWRMPSSAAIDQVSYRVHAFAFPLWTFAVLTGAIWADEAWGRFWGWDPKEVWAFITWVVYAAYLHARATAGWRGRGAAYIALAGYATFLFNFVGINLLGSGLHAYSGM
nr:c-type cytochrome biogenesis protein CcsB [Nocardioidaceae bacterium]